MTQNPHRNDKREILKETKNFHESLIFQNLPYLAAGSTRPDLHRLFHFST